MKIRQGDVVLVISGKDKGKTGVVVRTLATTHRLVVEGVNMRTRHIRKTPQQAGQKIHYEASIHVSNVMILDPKTKKPTRIRYAVDPKTGKKQRIAALSGEVIAKAAKTQPKKEAKKTDAAEKTTAPKTTKASEKTPAADAAETAAKPPKKEAFWKRVSGRGKHVEDGEQGSGEGGGEQHPTTTAVRRSRESS